MPPSVLAHLDFVSGNCSTSLAVVFGGFVLFFGWYFAVFSFRICSSSSFFFHTTQNECQKSDGTSNLVSVTIKSNMKWHQVRRAVSLLCEGKASECFDAAALLKWPVTIETLSTFLQPSSGVKAGSGGAVGLCGARQLVLSVTSNASRTRNRPFVTISQTSLVVAGLSFLWFVRSFFFFITTVF